MNQYPMYILPNYHKYYKKIFIGEIHMINIDYIKNIPEPKKSILHETSDQNLSNISFSSCSENECNNLLLNSNLEQFNTIK